MTAPGLAVSHPVIRRRDPAGGARGARRAAGGPRRPGLATRPVRARGRDPHPRRRRGGPGRGGRARRPAAARPRRRRADRGCHRDRAPARPASSGRSASSSTASVPEPPERRETAHARRHAGRGDLPRARHAARRLALASLFEAEFGQRTADGRAGAASRRDRGRPGDRRLRPDLVALPSTENRDTIDARIEAAAPQYPVVHAGPDGPRPAPSGHERGATLARDAGPRGDRRMGRAGTDLRRRPGPAPGERGPRTSRQGGRGRWPRWAHPQPRPRRTRRTPGGCRQWRPPTSG